MLKQISDVAEGTQNANQGAIGVEIASQNINYSIQNASATMEEQTASMEEIAASSNTLSGLAIDLRDLVERFEM